MYSPGGGHSGAPSSRYLLKSNRDEELGGGVSRHLNSSIEDQPEPHSEISSQKIETTTKTKPQTPKTRYARIPGHYRKGSL